MSTLLARWRAAEPVRLYLYGLLLPAACLAVGYGLATGEQAALWLALGGAVLVPPATEAARRRVTPAPPPAPPAHLAGTLAARLRAPRP